VDASVTRGAAGHPDPEVGGAGDIEVSVVMPCLNEVRTVRRCVAKALAELQRLGVRGEVIVADNGSTDGSPDAAKGAGARVVTVPDKGYGAALQGGIAAASGRYVIMGDADDSYDFGNLGPFLDRLRAGDDLVMGNRFLGGIRPSAMPWHHRYIGNPLLTGVLNLFFRSPIGDAHCGLRAFNKEAYRALELRAPGMEFASEMVIKACLRRQKISEVPTTLSPDGRGRPSHLRSLSDGWRHLRLLVLHCPDWVFLGPAVALMAVGLIAMVALTPGPLFVGRVGLDVHTMLVAAMTTQLGYQLLWSWALAKVYGWVSGVLPTEAFSEHTLRLLNLERTLLVGALLVLVGVALIGGLVVYWLAHGGGRLDVTTTMRPMIWGILSGVIGMQTIFGSLFLGMLGLPRRP
jgi:hypothetical protein